MVGVSGEVVSGCVWVCVHEEVETDGWGCSGMHSEGKENTSLNYLVR